MFRARARHVAIVLLAVIPVCPARAAETLLQTRPCGPDSVKGPLRWLIPQGAYGADFRAACRAHDACYDTPGASRAACDAAYLRAMFGACEHSRHPALCRMTARAMHRVTVRHGEESFQSAQRIALAKLAVE